MNTSPSPTRNPVTQERLQQIITFLETLPPEKFDFIEIVSQADKHGCGTVCCAIGWFPAIFPEDFTWGPGHSVQRVGNPGYFFASVAAGDFLHIPREVVQALFYNVIKVAGNSCAHYYGVHYAGGITKDMVVSALKYYLTRGKLATFKDGVIQ